MKGTILLMVGIGGALGSMARYLIAGWVQPAYWTGFPLRHPDRQYHGRPHHGSPD